MEKILSDQWSVSIPNDDLIGMASVINPRHGDMSYRGVFLDPGQTRKIRNTYLVGSDGIILTVLTIHHEQTKQIEHMPEKGVIVPIHVLPEQRCDGMVEISGNPDGAMRIAFPNGEIRYTMAVVAEYHDWRSTANGCASGDHVTNIATRVNLASLRKLLICAEFMTGNDRESLGIGRLMYARSPGIGYYIKFSLSERMDFYGVVSV